MGRVGKVLPAGALKGEGIVHPGDLLLMGHQIVMELPGRAMVQAAGIGQQVQLFAGFVAVPPQLPQRRHVPVQLPFDVERIEGIRQIVHAFRRADLHIDGSPDFKAFKILPEKSADHRRCGGDGHQIPFVFQLVHQIAGGLEKASGQAVGAVTIGVQQQIQADSSICDPGQFLPLPLGGLPGKQILLQACDAAAAWHGVPGKIHFINGVPVCKNVLQKRIGMAQLISDKQLHCKTPPVFLYHITCAVHEKCKKQARTYKKQAFLATSATKALVAPLPRSRTTYYVSLIMTQVLIAIPKNKHDGTKKPMLYKCTAWAFYYADFRF